MKFSEAEKRANLLNALQDVADSYGYDVAGYNDETEDDGFFHVLLLKTNHMEGGR